MSSGATSENLDLLTTTHEPILSADSIVTSSDTLVVDISHIEVLSSFEKTIPQRLAVSIPLVPGYGKVGKLI